MDELKQTAPTDLPVEATKISYSLQMDQKMDADLKTLSRFFLKHPSLALTFGYLIASVMGFIFTISLLNKFQFDALPYLELTDFLLAAITRPKIVLALMLCIASMAGVIWVERSCKRKYAKYAAWADQYTRSYIWMPNWLLLLFLFVSYLWIAGTAQVSRLSQDIKTHQTRHYQLSLIYPIQPGAKEIRQLNEVQIITRTASYLWLYHQDQVKLIPHANVAALIPVLKKELDKDADKDTDKKPEQKADKPATAEKTSTQQPAAVPVKS